MAEGVRRADRQRRSALFASIAIIAIVLAGYCLHLRAALQRAEQSAAACNRELKDFYGTYLAEAGT